MGRVLVLGLDGADKTLLLRWANDGTLPTIGSLMETGAWCTVENPPGLFAGSVWPSFFTGVSPARHGKYCSNQIETGTYDDHRVHGFDPCFHTIWDVLSNDGKTVAIIDAPKSEVSRDLNGIQVVDWGTEDFDIELRSCPPELAREIRRKYGQNTIVESDIDNTDARSLQRLRDELLSRLRKKSALSAEIFAQSRWDFFFTLFTEVHTAGHVCWHLHDVDHPRFDEALFGSVGDIVRDVYVATDSVLRGFIEQAGADTNIFVYSVNGMGANYTGIHLLDDILLARDHMQLSGGRHALARTANWIDRRIPGPIYERSYSLQRSIRRALSLPVRDRQFRSAFQVPTNAVIGGVRLNLIGREPDGIIEERDYDAFCQRLSGILAGLVNVDTGNSAICRVIQTRQVFAGKHIMDLPDILVEWAQDAPISSVYSSETGLVSKELSTHRTGDHRSDGVLFAIGPQQRRGAIAESISIYDLAPTISSLLGCDFPDADGVDASYQLGLS